MSNFNSCLFSPSRFMMLYLFIFIGHTRLWITPFTWSGVTTALNNDSRRKSLMRKRDTWQSDRCANHSASSVVFFFCGIWVWTQGHGLTRQVLYLWSTSSPANTSFPSSLLCWNTVVGKTFIHLFFYYHVIFVLGIHLQKFLQYTIVKFTQPPLHSSSMSLLPIPGIVSTGLIVPFTYMRA
jgi:hypothetical protein